MIKILFTGTSCPQSHTNDFEIVHIPFIKVEPEELSLNDKQIINDSSFNTWIFTSKNGVYTLLNNIQDFSVLKEKIIFAVGEKTASLLKKYVGNIIVPDEFNMKSLAKTFLEYEINGGVLVLSGRLRNPDLTNILRQNRVDYKEVFLYKTVLTPRKVKVDEFAGVVFFSPSGARSFFEKNTLNDNHKVFCIGTTTEEEVKLQYSGKIFKPKKSNMDGILNEIEIYLHKDIVND